MSTIHVVPQAAGQMKNVRVDARPPRFETSDKPQRPDQEMMYAWSMGVTDAAREPEHFETHEESCPPEVYIG
jgi:hypothetical protein